MLTPQTRGDGAIPYVVDVWNLNPRTLVTPGKWGATRVPTVAAQRILSLLDLLLAVSASSRR